MDLRRCLLVAGATVVALIAALALGVFVPSALLPSRFIEGGSRVIISAAIVLVSAMAIASTCRPSPERRPAKTEAASRNKTSD